ncbi:MAG TPA: carboxypeptidase regulatory-like domain-containing protein [Urbifossiella sp.]|nr:carboxypeptidase regulatory-like domain-containing protein [Urbifossiella sp.]
MTDPDGNPVAQTSVTLLDGQGNTTEVTTDASGRYQFPTLAYGMYDVFLGTANEPIGTAAAVTVSAASPTAAADLAAPASYTISGTVYAADGQTGLAGVDITLLSNGQVVGDASTDASGGYSLTLQAAGTYDLLAALDGISFTPATGIAVSGSNAAVTENFTAGQLALSGVIRDGVSGQPVAGVLVVVLQLVGSNYRTPVASTTTAGDGSYSVPGLAAGDYAVQVNAASYGGIFSQVTLPDPDFNLFGFSSITGQARNSADQSPLPGATVYVVDTISKQFVAPVTADINGDFIVTNLPKGTYDVLISSQGHQQSLVEGVSVQDFGQTYNIGGVGLDAAAGGVSGTISTDTAESLSPGFFLGGAEGATITLVDGNGIARGTATAAANGTYQLAGIPSGTYTITVSKPPGDPVVGTVTVGTGVTTYDASLHLIAPERYEPILKAINDGIAQFNDVTQQAFDAIINFLKEPVKRAADDPLIPPTLTTPACYAYWQDAVAAVTKDDDAFSTLQLAASANNQVASGIEQGLNVFVTAGKIAKAMAPFSSAAKAFSDFLKAVKNWPSDQLDKLESLKDILQAKQIISDVISAGKASYAATVALNNADADPLAAAAAIKAEAGAIVTVIEDFAKLKKNLEAIRGIAVLNVFTSAFDPLFNAIDAVTSVFDTYKANVAIAQNVTDKMATFNNAKEQYISAVAQANYRTALLNWCTLKATGLPEFQIPPPPPPGTKGDGKTTMSSASPHDPNDLIGPAGFGPQGFTQSATFPYRVDFENDPAEATAAAQVVTTTMTLDSDLDPSTFEFTGFGFGSHTFAVPAGLSHYQTTIDLRPDGIDLLVPVSLDLNPVPGSPGTYQVVVTFQSLDPLTRLAPPGVNAGFLPIDDASGDGKGFFTYTVEPKVGLPTGTAVTAQASVVFDTNAAIATLTALNTLDVTAPTSRVAPLTATQSTASFTVTWSGTDVGSGIASYDVFASDNGGGYAPFLIGTTSTSAVFTGQAGHSYSFYSVASDHVGLTQATPAAAQAATFISPPVVSPPPPAGAVSPVLVGYPRFAVGSDTGGPSTVTVFNPDGTATGKLDPFPGTTGGVRTAVGDFNGDGVPDVAVGTGPGAVAEVKIIDGASGAVLFDVKPFDAFTGGVFVAAGDISGDMKADLVITPDLSGGPRVEVYEGGDFNEVANFFGIDDPNFRGGARAALGDINGDGRADLVISAGFGGGPRISVYDGAALMQGRQVHLISDFFLFEQTLRNGAYVAVADVNGDGMADIIGGGGPGGGPRVLIISGRALLSGGPGEAFAAPVANFFAGDVENRGGVRVAAKNLDGDALADVVVGAGTGAGSRVTAYYGKNLGGADPIAYDIDAFPGITAGVFVG